jgi:hypothetical protein
MMITSTHTMPTPTQWVAIAFAVSSCALEPPLHERPSQPVPMAPCAHDKEHPAHLRARQYDSRAPFSSGEIDFFDLAAIYAGAPFEGRCSPFPEGTWRNIAGRMREQFDCESLGRAAAEPSVSAQLATCANELFSAGLQSTCSDFSAFGGYRSPQCDAAWSAYWSAGPDCDGR